LFTGSMGYLINAMKSSCVLLNYGAHKSVLYIDGQNVRKDILNKKSKGTFLMVSHT
jgi:hypothetical protein